MGRTTQEEQAHEAQERLQKALTHKQKHKLQDAPPITASCFALGSAYGEGIGLYFQFIKYIRILLFWLALLSVPYLVVVNTARFTTAPHRGQAGAPGVSVLPAFNILQSLTFAVLPDDALDGGLLGWMNVQLPGVDCVFAMSRPAFLTWISLLDAGSMAVFSIACLVLFRLAARFAQAVDDATAEVADYTVLVKGLPETTPVDIGHHFSKFGRVMDVVMVKDFGPLLALASTATSLEQQRKTAEAKLARGRKAAAQQRRIHKTEKKMAQFMRQANKQLDSSGFELKAVFVTFNTQGQAAACRAACPRRWLSSWFQPRRERFLGRYRFWVEAAKPPEDYIYENLSVSRAARWARMALVRLVVLAILLASAGAVTKLMAMNMEAARGIMWDGADMGSRIGVAMQAYPLSASQAQAAPQLANATLQRVAAAMGDDAAAQLAAGSFGPQLSYCSVQLVQACSEGLGRLLGTTVALVPASGAVFANLTDALLKREAFVSALDGCSRPGSSCPELAMCSPCHCSLLAQIAPSRAGDKDWVRAVRQECSGFTNTLDMHAYVMKGLISMTLVLLNYVLKAVLQWLVQFEKHVTQSDKERAYAVLAFVSQLLNSVLVLLLVNARSSLASQAINAGLSTGAASKYTSWGSNLILSGAYTDFSPTWYVDVGQSLELLIILNAVVSAAFTLAMWLQRKLQQCLLTGCMAGASQQAYNAAWIGWEFVLDARVSDLMLGLWIILMFGSGIPGLYVFGLVWLAVVELSDRWALARVCRTPARYGKSLPDLLLGLLPWAAATHCAFGVWQHTYFKAGHLGDEQISQLASSAGGDAAALSQTYAFRRVTQTNGLPLLVLLIVHLGIHVIIRFLLYFFSGRAFLALCGRGSGGQDGGGTDIEVTYEEALLARHSNDTSAAAAAAAAATGTAQGGGPQPAGARRRAAAAAALAGAPTYRLPHHPRYSDIFSNPLYKPIWFKAFGRLRYTTLVSRPGGGFIIAPEPILDHDETDMQQSLASMSPDLQNMARRLADSSADGLGKPGGKRTPRSSLVGADLAAMRERSRSVHVAVLAADFDSPRGSFTSGPGSPCGLRGRSMIEGLAERDASMTAAARAAGVHGSAASFAAAVGGGGRRPAGGAAGAAACAAPGPLGGTGEPCASPRHAAYAHEGSIGGSAYDGAELSHGSVTAPTQQPGWGAAVAADLRGSAVLLPSGHELGAQPGAAAAAGAQAGAATALVQDHWMAQGAPLPCDHQQQQQQLHWAPLGSSVCPAAFAAAPDGSQIALYAVATPNGVCYYPADVAAAMIMAPSPGAVVPALQGPASCAQLQAPQEQAPSGPSAGAAGGATQPGELRQQPAPSAVHEDPGWGAELGLQAPLQDGWAAPGAAAAAAVWQAEAVPVWLQVLPVPLPVQCAADGGGDTRLLPPIAPEGAASAAYAAAAGAAAQDGRGEQQEFGWMCPPDNAAAPPGDGLSCQGSSLWDGALAASASAAAATNGATGQAEAAALAAAASAAAASPAAAATAPVHTGAAAASGAFCYPATQLLGAWEGPPAAAAYPDVRLTTVEMLPAGCAVASSCGSAAAPYSQALLAGGHGGPHAAYQWPHLAKEAQGAGAAAAASAAAARWEAPHSSAAACDEEQAGTAAAQGTESQPALLAGAASAAAQLAAPSPLPQRHGGGGSSDSSSSSSSDADNDDEGRQRGVTLAQPQGAAATHAGPGPLARPGSRSGSAGGAGKKRRQKKAKKGKKGKK